MIDKTAYASMMKAATWEILDFKIGDDVEVRPLAHDAAVLAHQPHEDLVVDRAPVSFEAADASLPRLLGVAHALSVRAVTWATPYGFERRDWL